MADPISWVDSQEASRQGISLDSVQVQVDSETRPNAISDSVMGTHTNTPTVYNSVTDNVATPTHEVVNAWHCETTQPEEMKIDATLTPTLGDNTITTPQHTPMDGLAIDASLVALDNKDVLMDALAQADPLVAQVVRVTIDSETRHNRRLAEAVADASRFNVTLLTERKKRSPYYFDSCTHTYQVIHGHTVRSPAVMAPPAGISALDFSHTEFQPLDTLNANMLSTSVQVQKEPVPDSQEEELQEILKRQLQLQSLYFEKLKLYESQQNQIEKQEEIMKQQQIVTKLYRDIEPQDTHLIKGADDQWTRLQYMYRWYELFPEDDSWYKSNKTQPKRPKKEKVKEEEEPRQDDGDEQSRRSIRILKAKNKSENGEETIIEGDVIIDKHLMGLQRAEIPPGSQHITSQTERRQFTRMNRVCWECYEAGRHLEYNDSVVQCSGCYLCYHPTCLDLPLPTAIKISTYPWKCPQCKLCEVCVVPGDDDKLLLCDKCDKGYHTFCLDPPLDELPTGDWICSSCNSQGSGWISLPSSTPIYPVTPSGPPQLFDENGNPIKRKRGRPRKEEALLRQSEDASLYRPMPAPVRTPPPPLIGPNGEVIKRGRGRPRKYPRPEEG
eukprot:TRINITY_DN6072_c0_g1_i1.p1 TRINITY_DN6072_c0_g1~~TRINITY_DN6072_c0_g1_i1.p1  ORF type:complete len:623 (-),score=119.97 TRINITY_DN6072_c0_g1_i1:37-1872(-)